MVLYGIHCCIVELGGKHVRARSGEYLCCNELLRQRYSDRVGRPLLAAVFFIRLSLGDLESRQ